MLKGNLSLLDNFLLVDPLKNRKLEAKNFMYEINEERLTVEEYIRLTEIEEDYFHLLEANKRIEENVDNKIISMDTVMNNLRISKEELMDAEDVDIE